MKEIKFKHASSRKNTEAQHSDFTDPLLGIDEKATWYTGDIYAFGITALQLTYGSPPQIEATDVLQGQVTISTEMYERVVCTIANIQACCLVTNFISVSLSQCPFNKAFESLIKECCGPLAERLSVNQLVEHKFFKGADCPNPEVM